jgi:fibronectin type 3 domain-containing protein
VAVGSVATKAIALTNTGNASTTINQISVNAAGFVASGVTLPYTLAAGATVSVQIAFSPTAAGTYSATAVVASTAANSPSSIPISGTGTTVAPQHSVDLSWVDSDTGITGYNVYRATQTGGPYAKASGALLTSKMWTDTGVQAGQTYYYVITAVNPSGVESSYSTETKAIIPTP